MHILQLVRSLLHINESIIILTSSHSVWSLFPVAFAYVTLLLDCTSI